MVDSKLILDTLIGAVSSKTESSSPSSDSGLSDLLGAALNANSSSGSSGGNLSGGGGLADLLGAALGGATGQASSTGSGGGLGGLLNAALNSVKGSGGTTGGGLNDLLGAALGGVTGDAKSQMGSGGSSAGGLIDLVKDAVVSNPALAKTIAAGAAGLLLGTKSGRAISANAAKLGGLALIGTLAYKSLKSFQDSNSSAGKSVPLPSPEEYVPASAQTKDGPLHLARTMIAAAMADGTLDASEREKIASGLAQSDSADVQEWFRKELSKPATPEELAKGVTSIPQAAEVYAAARVVIEPDKDSEIDFLNRLSDALKLDGHLVAELDKSAAGIKVEA